ncbi:hypothetical protein OF83DRAFT_1175791 [Amylostereum chailletii]|nr:hypothetical protein OF83DRAFT_1175791 [Amylostereum chailletii]
MEAVPNVVVTPALLPNEDLPDSMRSALEKITKRSLSGSPMKHTFNYRGSGGVVRESSTDELLPLLLSWMPTSTVHSSSTFIPTPPLPERDDSTTDLFQDVPIIPIVHITPPSPTPDTFDFPSFELALACPGNDHFNEDEASPRAHHRSHQSSDANFTSWQIVRRPTLTVGRKHSTRRHCMIFTDDGVALPTATSRPTARSGPNPNPVPPKLLRTYASSYTLNQSTGFAPQGSTSEKGGRWRSGSVGIHGFTELTVKIGMVTRTLFGMK